MISCPDVAKQSIRRHYNLATPFYRLLWGAHIHHGYWEGNESPRRAQDQLTDRLASAAGISAGHRILDVGCGMGASARRLAALRECRVTGVTLSWVQRRWAQAAAWSQRLAESTDFVCADIESLELPAAAFDFIWSVECTEHLFDKAAFFRRAADWLEPGGAVAICAWLAGNDLDHAQSQQVFDVCEGFFCPSLGSARDYERWFVDAGLVPDVYQDWTERVARTWEICRDRVQRLAVRPLAKLVDGQQLIFLDRFQTILDAYLSGAMRYGCFVARKPS